MGARSGRRRELFQQGAVGEQGGDVGLVPERGGALLGSDARGMGQGETAVRPEAGLGAGEFEDNERAGGFRVDDRCGRVASQGAWAGWPGSRRCGFSGEQGSDVIASGAEGVEEVLRRGGLDVDAGAWQEGEAEACGLGPREEGAGGHSSTPGSA